MLHLKTLEWASVGNRMVALPSKVDIADTPSGPWIARVKTSAVLSDPFWDESGTIFQLQLYGTDYGKVLPKVTGACRLEEDDDDFIEYEYALIAMDPFVAVWRNLFGLHDPRYAISQLVQDEQLGKPLPELLRLNYQCGANRWRWVRLSQVLEKSGLARLEDVSDLIWNLIGTRIFTDPDMDPSLWTNCGEAEGQDDDRSWHASYKGLEIVLDSPENEPIIVALPLYGDIPDETTYIWEVDLELIWVPAKVALDLPYLLKFVK